MKTLLFLQARRAGLGLCLALALCLVGCGTSTITIKGKVTYDGTPVEEGHIAMEPVDGNGPALGAKIEGGMYRIDAPLEAAGKKVVRISAARKTGKQVQAEKPAPPGMMRDVMDHYIPAIYNTNSTLKADIVAGQVNQLDFPLEAKKKS